MEQKFYKCTVCGQIIKIIKQTQSPTVCCGKPMQEMSAGTTEASLEKHIPTFTIENNVVKVNVGSIEHPMTEEHFIEWVSLQTKEGCQLKKLSPQMKPYVEFHISNKDNVEAVFAYCNLHGLWKA